MLISYQTPSIVPFKTDYIFRYIQVFYFIYCLIHYTSEPYLFPIFYPKYSKKLNI